MDQGCSPDCGEKIGCGIVSRLVKVGSFKMDFSNADNVIPPSFSGTVRLFPLPNLVLLPGVIQALHIFEPRYRQLMEDSLLSDRLITMTLFKPGWEDHPSEQPEIHETVCVGKIITHSKMENGTYNLLLMGTQRARIIREVASDKPYRMAEVDLITDEGFEDEGMYQGLRSQVLDAFQVLVQSTKSLQNEAIKNLLAAELPVGALIDLIGFSSGAESSRIQKILEAADIHTRGSVLVDILNSRIEQSKSTTEPQGFPPAFSEN